MRNNSSFINLKDGTRLFYKDWGIGQPIVFSHGWPLTSDAFEDQMLFLAEHGFRVIAHDRRGHGRSSQSWDGNNMNQYADDLAALVKALDLHDVVHVGHSTGGGEVARYIARNGITHVNKAVLIAAVPPIMVKTEWNPSGLERRVFDEIRQQVQQDRSQFFLDLADKFYGFNRPGATLSEGLKKSFWLQGMMGSIKSLYDCVEAFSETDQRLDLKSMHIPTMVIYGDDDQIVPPVSSGQAAMEYLPAAICKVYPGASHGLCSTHKSEIGNDLLEFIKN